MQWWTDLQEFLTFFLPLGIVAAAVVLATVLLLAVIVLFLSAVEG